MVKSFLVYLKLMLMQKLLLLLGKQAQVLLVRLDLQVQQDPQDLQVQLAYKARLGLKVCRVYKVLKGCKVK
jgi:hypothetical protein